MTNHPKARRSPFSSLDRRRFLQGSAALAVGGAGASLLAACGGDNGGTGGATTDFELARPDNPVTLPIHDDLPPIEDGLEPETGGDFKILNYIDYMAPGIMKQFGERYDVNVSVTVYNNYDEMIQKIRQAGTSFDIVFPGPSRMSAMVAAKLLQPLNKSYIPNFTNLWPNIQSPFYDVGSLYSTPYTIYTTGVGYRADIVTSVPEDGHDLFWDPQYSGKTWVLDDSREAIYMSMLRNDITTDANTEDPEKINAATEKLIELIDLVNIKVGISGYQLVPEGGSTVHQAWSGDLIAGQYYLPKGESTDVLGYWKPETDFAIGNDVMAIPASASKPVLGHLLINDILDNEIGLRNFGWNGYQPPLSSIDPDTLISDGWVPENLESAIVREEDFDIGHQALEITPAGESLYQDAWSRFRSGA